MKGWCLIDVDERLIFDWQLNFCSAGHPNFKLRIEEKLMFDWCWWTIDFWLIFDWQLCLTSQFQTESWWNIDVDESWWKIDFWLTTQLLLCWPSQFQTKSWCNIDVDERLIFDLQLNFCSAGRHNFKQRVDETIKSKLLRKYTLLCETSNMITKYLL